MTESIDYHELAKAQVEFHDNEADRLAAQIPDELKAHPNGLYAIPARGSVPGAQRLATAQQIAARAKEHAASAATRSAEQAETAQRQSQNRADAELKIKLGLPRYSPFPPEFSASELRQFADRGALAEFAGELAKRKSATRAAHSHKPSFL